MLNDLYHAEYAHKEYERRIQAGLLVYAARNESAERTDATAHSLSQRLHCVTGLALALWQRGRHIVRRWSGQHDAIALSSPMHRER